MNTEQSLANNMDTMIPLLAYEKPEIITFGTVEKLTQGVGGSNNDSGQSNCTKHGVGGGPCTL